MIARVLYWIIDKLTARFHVEPTGENHDPEDMH